jgi:hypothetical protein
MTTSATTAADTSRDDARTGEKSAGGDASREAKRLAAVVLEVLAGTRSPPQAAEVVGVTLPYYYQLETRALNGLIAACEQRPRGRQPDLETELARLRQEVDRLQREVARHQALVRLTQRTVGVPPPAPKKGARRQRKPAVRALRRAEQLHDQARPESPGGSE